MVASPTGATLRCLVSQRLALALLTALARALPPLVVGFLSLSFSWPEPGPALLVVLRNADATTCHFHKGGGLDLLICWLFLNFTSGAHAGLRCSGKRLAAHAGCWSLSRQSNRTAVQARERRSSHSHLVAGSDGGVSARVNATVHVLRPAVNAGVCSWRISSSTSRLAAVQAS